MQQQRQQRPQPQDINKQPELLQRFAAPPPCAPHPLFINIRQPQHIIQNFCKRFAEGGAAPSPLHPPPAFFINNYNNYNNYNSYNKNNNSNHNNNNHHSEFLQTLCGGRRFALPPAPPTRFFIDKYNNYNKNNSNNNDNKRFVAAATATNGKQQGNDKTQIL